MNFQQVLAIVFILQGTGINARTMEDVLQDFQPIFDEIHNDIGNLQGNSHNIGGNQLVEIRRFLLQQHTEVSKNLSIVLNNIASQSQEIVNENGMQDHPDLIEHCSTAEQEGTSNLAEDAFTRRDVCYEIGTKKGEELGNILGEIYDEQNNLHYTVEDSKKICFDKSETPDELQSCLIDRLYFVHKPQVEALKNKSYEVLNNNRKFIDESNKEIGECFVIVADKINSDASSIVETFRRCVIEAANN